MIKILRTANAGVLLKLDGVSILLDGVCKEIKPYLKTPDNVKKELCENFPDVLAFTHYHEDHFDEEYAKEYRKKTLRSVYGPELLISETLGNLKFYPVETRHIGKFNEKHISYVISGSKTIWFMGDASPLEIKKLSHLQKPDILIAPFAYALSEQGFKTAKNTGAKNLIILHMPIQENDPYGIWQEVLKNTENDDSVIILKMNETVIL